MTIERLKSILPAPLSTDVLEYSKWATVEAKLGTHLPEEYKEFVTLYGTGSIDDFLWVLNPFSTNENLNLIKQSQIIGKAYIDLRNAFPKEYKHNIFPEENGLLVWAVTDNGDDIFWDTCGCPNSWKIVVYETRSSCYHEYQTTVTKFLHGILSRELYCDAFPGDFPSNNPVFVPIEQ